MRTRLMAGVLLALAPVAEGQSVDDLSTSERRVRQLALNGAEAIHTSTWLDVRDWTRAHADEIDQIATARLCTRLAAEEAGDAATPEQTAAAEKAHLDQQMLVGRAALEASNELHVPTLLEGRAGSLQSTYFLGMANYYLDGVMDRMRMEIEREPERREMICSR